MPCVNSVLLIIVKLSYSFQCRPITCATTLVPMCIHMYVCMLEGTNRSAAGKPLVIGGMLIYKDMVSLPQHTPFIPVQLMRPGIGRNISCILGDYRRSGNFQL